MINRTKVKLQRKVKPTSGYPNKWEKIVPLLASGVQI